MAYPGSPLYVLATDKGWDLPQTWSGFSQHDYDCLPLRTEKVSAAQVLDSIAISPTAATSTW
jgi:anaerobic magnesium-protoporphyrin IX monomethyl ester cyclase